MSPLGFYGFINLLYELYDGMRLVVIHFRVCIGFLKASGLAGCPWGQVFGVILLSNSSISGDASYIIRLMACKD